MRNQDTIDDLFSGEFGDDSFTYQSQENKQEVISETDLRAFFKCPYAYHMKTNIGFSKTPRSGFPALAMFFESARKSLFNLRDPKIGRLFPFQTHAGPELKTAEQMTPEELKQFLSTSQESIGGLLSGRWGAYLTSQQYAGAPLVWSFESQGFQGRTQLKKAGQNYYQFVLENGAPIMGFMNKAVSFEFQGLNFRVKFPELRPRFLDDISLWNFNAEFPEDRSSDVSNSSLVTLRLLAYYTLAVQYPFYRLKWRISDETADKWEKTGLDPNITYRHLNAAENTLTTATRTKKDLDLLKKAIDRFKDYTSKQLFPPNQQSCGTCALNCVDETGDILCRKIKPGIKPSVPLYYLKPKNYHIETQEQKDSIVLTGKIKKSITSTIEKIVATLTLPLSETKTEIGVNSIYQSNLRGLGYEVPVLEQADKKLQQLADSRKKQVVHTLHFDRDFKFAGQKKIRARLSELGYEPTEHSQILSKTYAGF